MKYYYIANHKNLLYFLTPIEFILHVYALLLRTIFILGEWVCDQMSFV